MRHPASPWSKTDRRRRDARFQAKRDAVFRAAAALFREKGYDGASLSDLADRLEITKPTIYYYAKNKEDLLFEIFRAALDRIHAGMEAAAMGDASGYARLRAILLCYADVLSTDDGACLVRIPWRSFADPATRLDMDRRMRSSTLVVLRVLEDGRRDGSLQHTDPDLTVQALFGSLSWAALWPRAEDGRIETDVAERHIDLLLNGVRNLPSAEGQPLKR